jgi:NADH:ubiquinone oxidoreductase subunit 5 (subunit L)/multisubunit Na+/H+ antiporter MnhA subunit
VSSLVHSSTLVTAGVFVLIRLNFLITPIQYYITILSLITIVLAGIFAIIENDFKKVVAISTLRQIGFIVFSISLGY